MAADKIKFLLCNTDDIVKESNAVYFDKDNKELWVGNNLIASVARLKKLNPEDSDEFIEFYLGEAPNEVDETKPLGIYFDEENQKISIKGKLIAEVTDLSNYYTKNEVYSKEESDEKYEDYTLLTDFTALNLSFNSYKTEHENDYTNAQIEEMFDNITVDEESRTQIVNQAISDIQEIIADVSTEDGITDFSSLVTTVNNTNNEVGKIKINDTFYPVVIANYGDVSANGTDGYITIVVSPQS